MGNQRLLLVGVASPEVCYKWWRTGDRGCTIPPLVRFSLMVNGTQIDSARNGNIFARRSARDGKIMSHTGLAQPHMGMSPRAPHLDPQFFAPLSMIRPGPKFI